MKKRDGGRGCGEEGESKKVFWNGDDSLLDADQNDHGKETRFFPNLFHSQPTGTFVEQLDHNKRSKLKKDATNCANSAFQLI